MATVHWWWVRHAPVVAQFQGCINGQNDVPANVGNLKAIAELVAQLPTNAIWLTSPLMRTVQTADALAPNVEAIAEPAFAEQHFGDWQELRWDDISGPEAHAFWTDPVNAVPPHGESFAAMAARVQAAIDRWRDETARTDIVVVAHAGPIRAAVAQARHMTLSDALSLDVAPLSLTRL